MDLSTLVRKDNTFRVEAALGAAGAWDADPLEVGIPGADSVLLFCAYTPGAAGGAVDLILEASPYSVDGLVLQNWHELSVVAVGAVVAGADVTADVQREGWSTYEATGGDREGYILGAYGLAAGVERLRVTCRESGVLGTPGEMHVVGVVS